MQLTSYPIGEFSKFNRITRNLISYSIEKYPHTKDPHGKYNGNFIIDRVKNGNTLLIGEGNLSFSLSLIKKNFPIN